MVLVGHIMHEGPEWMREDKETGALMDKNRTTSGHSLLESDAGVGAVVRKGKIGQAPAMGRALAATSLSTADHGLLSLFVRVNDIASSMGISRQVAESGSVVLKQLEERGLLTRKKGAAGDAVSAAALYVACRQHNAARSLKEIAPAANVEKRQVAKAFKLIQRNLDISVGAVRGEHLIPRCCSMMGLSTKVSQAAKHVAQRISELELCGGLSPQSVAAACIIFAGALVEMDTSLDPDEVGRVSGSTLNSARRVISTVYPHRNELVPDYLEGSSLRLSALLKEHVLSSTGS